VTGSDDGATAILNCFRIAADSGDSVELNIVLWYSGRPSVTIE
jgi:hypothetical protein